MTKNAARRDKFRKLGQLISKMGDPNVPDYWTGRAVKLMPKRSDSQNRDSEDPLNRDKADRTEIPLGPKFATPQWERALV